MNLRNAPYTVSSRLEGHYSIEAPPHSWRKLSASKTFLRNENRAIFKGVMTIFLT